MGMRTEMLKRVKNNIITAEKKYDVLKKWTLAVAEADGEEFEFSATKDVTAAGITTVPANDQKRPVHG